MPALHQLPLLPSTLAQLRCWYSCEVPIATICHFFNVCRATVRTHTHDLKRRNPWNKINEALTCSRYKEGWSKRDFESIHLDWDRVRKILQKNRVQIRPIGRPPKR